MSESKARNCNDGDNEQRNSSNLGARWGLSSSAPALFALVPQKSLRDYAEKIRGMF